MTPGPDRLPQVRLQHYAPYRQYRDSGVEWLGNIPAHWKVRRLKTLASVRLSNVDKKSEEGQIAVKLCNYVDVYYNDFITADLKFMAATATPAQLRRFVLRVGDVLITKDSESWNDIAVPAVVVEELTAIVCGYHLALIQPLPGSDGRFLARQFSSIGLRDQFHLAANGITRFGLGGDAIRASVFPVAPVGEQRAIANFLDRETAKIDSLVATKERLIGLLQEKRTALITRTVTRGLDPNIPTKDSGVDWLGEVPQHWDVERAKWVARMESGHTPDKKVDAYWVDGDIPWVSLNDSGRLKNQDYVHDTDYYTNELGLANSSARLLPPRAVVLSRDATIGLCAITERPMAVSQHFIAWICRGGMIPEYLLRVFDAMKGELDRLAMGATLRTIGMPDVKTLTTPVPPVDEQEAIVDHIQQECLLLDNLTAKVHSAINHLKEYRTALISAAVTGKIDVRQAASP